MVFPYTVLIRTDFFPKILIFLVIYTDFVSDHSGRSVEYVCVSFKVKSLFISGNERVNLCTADMIEECGNLCGNLGGLEMLKLRSQNEEGLSFANM